MPSGLDKSYLEVSPDGGTNYVPLSVDVSGAQSQGYNTNYFHTTVTYATATTTAMIVGAPGTNTSLVVTAINFDAADPYAGAVFEGDTAAATLRFNVRHWATMSTWIPFKHPWLFETNTALSVTTNVANTQVFIQGYTADRS